MSQTPPRDQPASRSLACVYLVRHGETAWSLSGQHTGRTDLPLTPHGEEEARALGEQLQVVTFARVFSSPLVRARETCAQIGWKTIEIDADLIEWNYGDYEGLRLGDIRKTRPDWNIFRDGCPNGESPAQVSDRADRLLARLRALPGNLAICSHGHFGRVLGVRWIGLPIEQAQHLLLGTASVSVLGYEHDRVEEPAIASWNAASHLCGERAIAGPAVERWEDEGGQAGVSN